MYSNLKYAVSYCIICCLNEVTFKLFHVCLICTLISDMYMKLYND
jgi:hypothetical protein